MGKGKQSNIIFDITIFLLGLFLVIYNWFTQDNFLETFYVLLGVYGIIKLSQYFLQNSKKDRENLYTAIACFAVILVFFVKFPNQNMTLTFSLLAWISIMSIIKLINLDYLHDRSMAMFKVRVVGFLLFVLVGVVTNYTLLFRPVTQYEVIGFFFIINGMIYIGEGVIREYDFQLDDSKAKKNNPKSKKVSSKKA